MKIEISSLKKIKKSPHYRLYTESRCEQLSQGLNDQPLVTIFDCNSTATCSLKSAKVLVGDDLIFSKNPFCATSIYLTSHTKEHRQPIICAY